MSQQEIFKKLADSVLNGDEDKAKKAAQEAIKKKIDAYDAIMLGAKKGMDIVSAKYEAKEMFIPEVLGSANAMYAAMDVLKPYLDAKRVGETGTVIIGVVEGDTHDIGKNLVRMLLEASGFNVIDLGRDVPLDQFLSSACDNKADVIAASTLMTTTLLSVEDLMKMLNEQGVRSKYKVIVGGAAINASFAEEVGADAYAEDASKGVKAVKKLIAQRRGNK